MESKDETDYTDRFGDDLVPSLEVIDKKAGNIMAALWMALDPARGSAHQKAVLCERDGERAIRIAATFIRKHEHHFPAIFWVDACPFKDLPRNISPEKRDLSDLEESDLDEERFDHLLERVSRKDEGWLMVIEKADSWAQEQTDALLRQAGGRILLLTAPETITGIVEKWEPDLNIMAGSIYAKWSFSDEEPVRKHRCRHIARCV